MPYADSNGYTSRSVAEKQFSRSKSSFIRDVDEAFSQNNEQFLENFCVFLNDGAKIVGMMATKEEIDKQRKKQPRWFIKTSFLESRYWEKSSSVDAKKGSAPHSSSETKSTSVETRNEAGDLELRHQLEIANEKLNGKDIAIEGLEADKKFLQDELSHRRGEIDRLRELVSSVGDSAAKLKTGESDTEQQSDSPTVSANAEVVEVQPSTKKKQSTSTSDKKRYGAEKYVPTVYKAIRFFRNSNA